MEKQDFWILFGLIVLLDLNLMVHRKWLRLHDEMLFAELDRQRSESLGG